MSVYNPWINNFSLPPHNSLLNIQVKSNNTNTLKFRYKINSNGINLITVNKNINSGGNGFDI